MTAAFRHDPWNVAARPRARWCPALPQLRRTGWPPGGKRSTSSASKAPGRAASPTSRAGAARRRPWPFRRFVALVGIDAHKAQLQVAVFAPDAAELTIWTVRNEARLLDRLRRRREKVAPGPIACCYQARPCGYALQRQRERGRVRCDVIAPALVPRKPGERIKTDRRDARKSPKPTRSEESIAHDRE